MTEPLEYVPGRFKVIRHVRPKLSCRTCDAMIAAPAPDPAIARGIAGAGLLAHVSVSKYADHLPLYRQSEIYAREGVDLERSTLAAGSARGSGCSRRWSMRSRAHVLGDKLHADDTPVPVLAPGTGKTKTGRLWTYVRDERPSPAITRRQRPIRLLARPQGRAPAAHLQDFQRHAARRRLCRLQRIFRRRHDLPKRPAGPMRGASSSTIHAATASPSHQGGARPHRRSLRCRG